MYNQIQLLGRIGQIERKTDHIVEASLATSDRYRDKTSGELKEDTQWHTLKFLNRIADIAEQHAHKGDMVMVVGKMTYRKYTNNAGESRSVPEVLVSSLYLIPKGSPKSEPAAEPQQKFQPKPQPAAPEDVEELPF